LAVTSVKTSTALGGLARRLVHDGIVQEAAVEEAEGVAKQKGTPLVSYLVSNQIADPREVALAASLEFGVPLLDLDAMHLDPEVLRTVSEQILNKHRILPVFRRAKKLYIAVSDPTNLQAIDEVKFATGLSIEAVVVEEDKLQRHLSRALEALDSSALSNFTEDEFDLENLEVSSGDDAGSDDVTRDDVEDAPIVRFVNKILLDAIKKGASDIHFEPYEKTFRVRTRLDGVLKEIALPPVQLAPKIAARIKVMSRLDIAERRVPQDGRIKMRLSKNRAIDFRVSSCPTLYGEKIVLRILDPSSAKLGIDALGYEEFQ